MALQTEYNLVGWESTFIEVSISAASTKIYAQKFSSREIMRDSLHMLDRVMLKELGINMMDYVLTLLKLIKETPVSPTSYVKPLTAKLPQLNSEFTTQEF